MKKIGKNSYKIYSDSTFFPIIIICIKRATSAFQKPHCRDLGMANPERGIISHRVGGCKCV